LASFSQKIDGCLLKVCRALVNEIFTIEFSSLTEALLFRNRPFYVEVKSRAPGMGDVDCQRLSFDRFQFCALAASLFEITAADGKGIAMRVAFGVMILAAFNIVLTLLAFRPMLKPL
jgi:lipid A ethanolaminephosphotransferase